MSMLASLDTTRNYDDSGRFQREEDLKNLTTFEHHDASFLAHQDGFQEREPSIISIGWLYIDSDGNSVDAFLLYNRCDDMSCLLTPLHKYLRSFRPFNPFRKRFGSPNWVEEQNKQKEALSRFYKEFDKGVQEGIIKLPVGHRRKTEEDREKEEEEYLKKKNEWQRKRNEWVSPEAVKERRQKRRAKFVENRDNTLYPAYEFRKRLNSCLDGVVEAADRRLNLTGIDDLKLETLEYQPSLGLKTDGGITLNVDVDRIVLSFLFDYERPDMGKSYDKDDKRPFYEEADRDDVVYDDDGYVAMDTYQNSRHESLGRFFIKMENRKETFNEGSESSTFDPLEVREGEWPGCDADGLLYASKGVHKSIVHYLRHSIIKGDLVHPISINGFITNNDSGMDEDVLYSIEMRDVSNYGRSKKNELPTDIQTCNLSIHSNWFPGGLC